MTIDSNELYTNSSTVTGSKTNAIEKSPYLYFRLDENLANACAATVNTTMHASPLLSVRVEILPNRLLCKN